MFGRQMQALGEIRPPRVAKRARSYLHRIARA